MFDEKTWKYGMLFRDGHEMEYFVIQDFEGNESYVIPETVGQFTGKKDINNYEIYESQKVRGFYDKTLVGENEFYGDGIVVWNNQLGCFSVDTGTIRPAFSCFDSFEILETNKNKEH